MACTVPSNTRSHPLPMTVPVYINTTIPVTIWHAQYLQTLIPTRSPWQCQYMFTQWYLLQYGMHSTFNHSFPSAHLQRHLRLPVLHHQHTQQRNNKGHGLLTSSKLLFQLFYYFFYCQCATCHNNSFLSWPRSLKKRNHIFCFWNLIITLFSASGFQSSSTVPPKIGRNYEP